MQKTGAFAQLGGHPVERRALGEQFADPGLPAVKTADRPGIRRAENGRHPHRTHDAARLLGREGGFCRPTAGTGEAGLGLTTNERIGGLFISSSGEIRNVRQYLLEKNIKNLTNALQARSGVDRGDFE